MTLTLTLNIFIFSSSCLYLSMFRPQAAIVSKKSTYRKDYVQKFDLAVKLVNVNSGSSFVYYDGLESQMLPTKFRRIGPMVLEENILK